jgi:uncharacterized protein (DUF2132 family)
MKATQPDNPLHGVTLEMILNELASYYGWDDLGRQIDIRCFKHEPGIASSLKFLRRTPWARGRVESLYLRMLRQQTGNGVIQNEVPVQASAGLIDAKRSGRN